MADESLASTPLREENLALKDLFGLNLTLKRALFTVSLNQTLAHSAIKDFLFLAIDVEGGLIGQRSLSLQSQLGISILDTRHLQTLISSYERKIDNSKPKLQSFLQTYNLCYGPRKYYRRARDKFLFGETEEMVAEEMNIKIQNLILGRDVILVIHGGVDDLRFLDRLKIYIQPICILDTQNAAQNPLQLSFKPSLERLLTILEIPFLRRSLHNDANYTLRSLLMIAVKDSEMEQGLDDKQHALLRVIQELARSPLPENGNQKC